ncbi:hypothetical protein DIPPA_32607 [Diplonema papillatum]|nr:hypothetical protein DIPPA_32607 [Diplonema papillatum]
MVKIVKERIEATLGEGSTFRLARPEIRNVGSGEVFSMLCFAGSTLTEKLLRGSGREKLFVKNLVSRETFDSRKRYEVVWMIGLDHGEVDEAVRRMELVDAQKHWGLVVSRRGFGIRVEEGSVHLKTVKVEVGGETDDGRFYRVRGIPADAQKEQVTRALAKMGWSALVARPVVDDKGRDWVVKSVTAPPSTEVYIDGAQLTIEDTERPRNNPPVADKSKPNQIAPQSPAGLSSSSKYVTKAELDRLRQALDTQHRSLRKEVTDTVEESSKAQTIKLDAVAKLLRADVGKQIERAMSKTSSELATTFGEMLRQQQEETREMLQSWRDEEKKESGKNSSTKKKSPIVEDSTDEDSTEEPPPARRKREPTPPEGEKVRPAAKAGKKGGKH